MTEHPLGRRKAPDWEHVNKFPLTSNLIKAFAKPQPMAIGVNWYPAFDRPEKDSRGYWWIKMPPPGQRIRGGHAICLKERFGTAPRQWWEFYDQGSEGACVGFACSRMMTHLNRERYDARWLYRQAQFIDEWTDTPPEEGTSVRAGLEILRTRGHVKVWGAKTYPEDRSKGISVYRWIRSIDDALEVLGYQDLGYVDLLNSWGTAYPNVVRMPVEVLARLWDEDGEMGVVTDV